MSIPTIIEPFRIKSLEPIRTTTRTGRQKLIATMDLVRLAIPPRVYTQSHIEYVVEVILDVWRRRDKIPGSSGSLSHFTARLQPASR
jgi:tryptophanase